MRYNELQLGFINNFKFLKTKNMKTIILKKTLHAILSSMLFLILFVHPALAENETEGFLDVARSHEYYVPINYLTGQGVIKGYSDKTFKSENPINRAEVLKVILVGSGIKADLAYEGDFPDVNEGDWFSTFVMKGRELGVVKGNDQDGTFAPGRQVNLAEFLKMLVTTNKISIEKFTETSLATNMKMTDWYAPYMNYAITVGIIENDSAGNINPSKNLSRGEVVSMLYLFSILQHGEDTQFLLSRSETEMAQIEVYIAANKVSFAKVASSLAVDLTQQAYHNLPENDVVLGAAKLARSYDYLVDSFISGVQKKNAESASFANQAIQKASEAWEVNHATQPIARHIKDRAREILKQVGGSE